MPDQILSAVLEVSHHLHVGALIQGPPCTCPTRSRARHWRSGQRTSCMSRGGPVAQGSDKSHDVPGLGSYVPVLYRNTGHASAMPSSSRFVSPSNSRKYSKDRKLGGYPLQNRARSDPTHLAGLSQSVTGVEHTKESHSQSGQGAVIGRVVGGACLALRCAGLCVCWR